MLINLILSVPGLTKIFVAFSAVLFLFWVLFTRRFLLTSSFLFSGRELDDALQFHSTEWKTQGKQGDRVPFSPKVFLGVLIPSAIVGS